MWPYLLKRGVKIHFAHRTFRWTNEATGKAAVHCVIIGFGSFEVPHKRLFEYEDVNGEPICVEAKNINPYLVNGPDVVVIARRKPLMAGTPKASYGSFALDGGIYTLSEEEKQKIINDCPKAEKYIRKFMGGQELIHTEERFCIWLADAKPEEIRGCPEIARRVEAVRQWRLLSDRVTTKNLLKHHIDLLKSANPRVIT